MAAVSPQDVHRAFADTDRIDDEDVLEKCRSGVGRPSVLVAVWCELSALNSVTVC